MLLLLRSVDFSNTLVTGSVPISWSNNQFYSPDSCIAIDKLWCYNPTCRLGSLCRPVNMSLSKSCNSPLETCPFEVISVAPNDFTDFTDNYKTLSVPVIFAIVIGVLALIGIIATLCIFRKRYVIVNDCSNSKETKRRSVLFSERNLLVILINCFRKHLTLTYLLFLMDSTEPKSGLRIYSKVLLIYFRVAF
jgi:hypothetical protein